MDWHQLEYFHTLAQVQHFTRAAEKLSITQPALSRSIAKLEQEIGVPLFERRNKTIALNQFGEIFFRHADRALQEITAAQKEINDLIDPDRGVISLAFLHSLGPHLIPDLLGKFRQQFPNIQFKLYQNSSHLIHAQLRTGQIDLCLSSSPLELEPGIEWLPLYTEELFIVVPTSHRLAGQGSINLLEIGTDPVITFKPDFGLRILTDQLFQQHDLSPTITFEGDEIMTVAGLVERGLGIAFIPHLKELDTMQLAFLPIADKNCYRTIGLARMGSRHISPAVKKFRDFIQQCFA